jgi:thioredoxin reductase (NADPH)
MIYDIVIIGGGPAGLSAAIYAARYKLKTLLLSKNMGGIASRAHVVCNYPSYSEIKGFELMQKMIKHVEDLNVEIIYDDVKKIENKKLFYIETENKVYESKKLILALGTERVRLNVPGEGRLYGRGVSYCATCDAPLFKDKSAVVIGGGDSALTTALLLSDYAKEVTIIYRKDKFFRAEPSWIDIVNKNKKIKKMCNDEIVEVTGKDRVENVKLKSGKTKKTDGVFIEIGSVPEVKILNGLKIKTNDKNYVIVDKSQKTNVHGIFAAGDLTDNELKQIVTAVGEGAIASYSAYKEVKKND